MSSPSTPDARPATSRPPLRRRKWWFAATALLLTLAAVFILDLRTRFELQMGRRALAALEFDDANSWAESVLARHPASPEGLQTVSNLYQ